MSKTTSDDVLTSVRAELRLAWDVACRTAAAERQANHASPDLREIERAFAADLLSILFPAMGADHTVRAQEIEMFNAIFEKVGIGATREEAEEYLRQGTDLYPGVSWVPAVFKYCVASFTEDYDEPQRKKKIERCVSLFGTILALIVTADGSVSAREQTTVAAIMRECEKYAATRNGATFALSPAAFRLPEQVLAQAKPRE